MLPAVLRLVLYVRVSTEDQRERGASLAAQVAKLKEYCDRFGHQVVETVEDGGESARTLDRPGIRRCLELIEAKQVDGMLVANLDRLTRHVGDVVGLVESHFTAPGGPVLLSASEPTETRTAVGRLQIYITVTVSQYQREAGAERTAGVMRFKRARAERTGNIAFGLEVNPEDPRRSKGGKPIALIESAVDHANEELILDLREQGLTYQAIADELNRSNVPAKRGLTRKSTGRWSKSTVHGIVKRAEARTGVNHERGEDATTETE